MNFHNHKDFLKCFSIAVFTSKLNSSCCKHILLSLRELVSAFFGFPSLFCEFAHLLYPILKEILSVCLEKLFSGIHFFNLRYLTN